MLPGIGFQLDPDSVWANLKSVGMVESIGQVDDKTTAKSYSIGDKLIHGLIKK